MSARPRFRIVATTIMAPGVTRFEIEAPRIARRAQPGQFVVVRVDEQGERIPLTIAERHPDRGSIAIVFQAVGYSTRQMAEMGVGDSLADVLGPLGKPTEIKRFGRVACVAGGLGIAFMFPEIVGFAEAGNEIISILGARSKDLFFYLDEIRSLSTNIHICTDDGSMGRHGLVTDILKELLEKGEHFDYCIATGPLPMMRATVNLTKEWNLPTLVSLDPIMVDGTGMCGGCRVTVGGEVKFACVDGPDFDGHLVDFDELAKRKRAFFEHEQCLLEPQIERLARESAESDRSVAVTPSLHAERGKGGEVLSTPGKRSPRNPLPHRPPAVRVKDFEEVALGFALDAALSEAKRCLKCKRPSCVPGCPVGVDIPGFIGALAEERFEDAVRILKEKNALPAICGRVCPQETQCEASCVLGKKAEPVAIGALERFVADWEIGHLPLPEPAKLEANAPKVAVIGSGPGGLTAAADLARFGYRVTLFESLHAPGGVLRYGIPEFRLPRTILDRELDYVRRLGVEIETDTLVGNTISLEELMGEEGYEAVFVGTGAGLPYFLHIPGENLGGVYSANEFLTRINLMKAFRFPEYRTPVRVGKETVVIGGGNVAMDSARSALRLGAKSTLVYRRTRAELPARKEEVENALEEGVNLMELTIPLRMIGDDKGHVTGLECLRSELGEPDESGRRRPVPIPNSEFIVPADTVVVAVSQAPNPLLTGTEPRLKTDKWGKIIINADTGETSIPGVFAGGDIANDAGTVIAAMGDGKRAAKAMHEYLQSRRG